MTAARVGRPDARPSRCATRAEQSEAVMPRLVVRCDPGSYATLEPRARGWDRTLQRELHDELTRAAQLAASLAQRNARRLRLPGLPPSANPEPRRSTGLRAALASGVTVVARPIAGGVECQIHSSHDMTSATNADSFRHPVFGVPVPLRTGRERWVVQESQPWWSNAIDGSYPKMKRAASRALDDAVRDLA